MQEKSFGGKTKGGRIRKRKRKRCLIHQKKGQTSISGCRPLVVVPHQKPLDDLSKERGSTGVEEGTPRGKKKPHNRERKAEKRIPEVQRDF